jgi:2-desacetyl-2-hydroxyethyl bacteriochlorophyllide A dehydrogenase
VKQIMFPEKGVVACEDIEPLATHKRDQVRVRTEYSLVSTGTETIALHAKFDSGTHWADWVRYPFAPGYSLIGTVVEAGSEVTDLKPGDRVAARLPHAEEQVVEARLCTKVPSEIDPKDAAWFGLAKIALIGARAAAYELGDEVVIVGSGPIGQMSVRWAAAAGATTIIAVDMLESRLALAVAGGATHTVSGPISDAHARIGEACGGIRPRVIVDTTGNALVLPSALGIAADRGRVVLLGDSGSPASQHLTYDVVVRGVSVVGAHDGHSVGEHWDGDRGLHERFFKLVLSGRIDLSGLNTHQFQPASCADAYRLASENRGDTMGILFDWTS